MRHYISLSRLNPGQICLFCSQLALSLPPISCLSPSQGNIENESKLCAVKLCCYYKLLEFVNMTATFYLLKMIKVGDFNLAKMSSLIESLSFTFLKFYVSRVCNNLVRQFCSQ